MSRYELKSVRAPDHVIKAVVGWDRPLQTFFAQVFTRTEEDPVEGEATIWFGTEPGELPTPDAALAVVAPYVDVPDTLAESLAQDMRTSAGVRDGAHQAEAKRRLFGSMH